MASHQEKQSTYKVLEQQKKNKRKSDRKLFKELIAENFPNLGRDLDIQGLQINSI